ncbi:MAG TPA: DUF3261 domain-containing protein [Steroidobacteraceae bacterium]|nr:DUF3261 domain-containing protein [Steroidobacteraceae bacterium]
MKPAGSLFARLSGCVALLALGACVGSPPPKAAVSLRPLVAPESLGGERVVNQVVRGAFGARELTFNCVVTVKDGAMTLVGMNSLGVRLFTIRYDGKAVHSETTPALQGSFVPERLLADMQLVFWPLSSLEKPMREAGWQLSESAPGIRRLRHGDQLTAEAHYGTEDPWSGRSWLVNFEFGYSLQIDSQPM